MIYHVKLITATQSWKFLCILGLQRCAEPTFTLVKILKLKPSNYIKSSSDERFLPGLHAHTAPFLKHIRDKAQTRLLAVQLGRKRFPRLLKQLEIIRLPLWNQLPHNQQQVHKANELNRPKERQISEQSDCSPFDGGGRREKRHGAPPEPRSRPFLKAPLSERKLILKEGE